MTSLFNSAFSNWETPSLLIKDVDSEFHINSGFDCVLPFFKVVTQQALIFNFSITKKTKILIAITNNNGETLLSNDYTLNSGSHHLNLNIDNLELGNYFVHLKSNAKFKVDAIFVK
jgi:hypothetical protein